MEKLLSSLSNQELVTNLTALVAVEKTTNDEVVLHLAEVERRKLYLSLGHSSLFDYAVSGLGYSRSAAYRRIDAARVSCRHPEVERSLIEGKISLSAIQSLSAVITPANAKELLSKIESGQQTIARVVAEYKPVGREGMKDRIVPVSAKKENSAQGSLLNFMENVVSSTAKLPENTEELYRISVTVNEGLKEKLDRMKELLGNAELATILDRAFDCYIDRHCPKERQKRCVLRKEKGTGKPAEKAPMAPVKPENARYAPVAMEANVFERDDYRCTYVGVDGGRCQAKACLELDHCQPYAMAGRTEYENLRTLCRNHNQLQARVAFGAARIEGIIAGKRKVKASMPHCA